MKKSTRREIAKDTLKTIKQGYYKNAQGKTIGIKSKQNIAQQKTKFHKGEELQGMIAEMDATQPYTTTFEITQESTLSAILRLYAPEEDLLTLVSASAKHPGGGFLSGSQEQEESLARTSGLYSCQLKGERYYVIHRNSKTPFYTDNMIYSPHVPIFKTGDGKYLDDPVFSSFITSPAVNKGVIARQEPGKLDQVGPVMKERMKKMLALAHKNGHKTLLLCEWGCGVFENTPSSIAKWFHEVFENEFKGKFERVIFAIYTKDEEDLKPWKELFG